MTIVQSSAVITRPNILHFIWSALTEAEYKSEFKLTKDTLKLILTGWLWSVYCDDLGVSDLV